MMKTQQKLDKVLEAVRDRVQEEVGSLMGVDFKLSEPVNQLISKEEYFAQQSGKKIVAKVDVTGEIEGDGGLVIGLRDGIRLGGSLIMLPSSELEEVVKSENYTEETEDSYGEIANIIAGSYTKVFEEMYPKSCRFVRKEQCVVAPLKLDTASAEPIPDQWYYWVKCSMVLEGAQMGNLDMLMPAESFGLQTPAGQAADTDAAQASQPADAQGVRQTEQAAEKTEVTAKEHEEHQPQAGQPEQEEPQRPAKPALSGAELEKQKKLVEKILQQCATSVGEEVSALLGADIKLGRLDNRLVSKEDFFLEEASGKQVMAHMDVAAAEEARSYLFVSVRDAIRMGAILIMLPPSEMEVAVGEEDFTPDIEDAYGEIANIISGVYTAVFQEQFSDGLRFIRKEMEIVAPMKVDTDSDDVIPRSHYYMSCSELEIGGKACGRLSMLFPAELLKLHDLAVADAVPQNKEVGEAPPESAASPVHAASPPGTENPQAPSSTVQETVEVLIIENRSDEAHRIAVELQRLGVSSKSISFSENIQLHITSALRLVIIVMQEVNEQAYGIAIKVSSSSSAPIVAAGAEWTRSKVIKAVKYGVQDILLLPATQEDIREKVQGNIIRLAA